MSISSFKNSASDVTHFFSMVIRSVDSLDACIYAEIRTTIPDTISWDYNFEPAGGIPLTFTVKVFSCLRSYRIERNKYAMS